MADELDKVAAGLAELEVTVAQGFHDVAERFAEVDQRFNDIDRRFHDIDLKFHEAELRDSALSRKIDVNAEAVRGDLRTVLDAVSSLADELRRATASTRKEHAADREIFRIAIEDHSKRLHKLEL